MSDKETKLPYTLRVTPELYDDIERKCADPFINSSATPQQVGFLLGVQFVLRKLRDNMEK